MVKYKKYIKDGVVRRFKIVDGKVLTTIGNVMNPTLEHFLADGWQEYIEPTPPAPTPYVPTYSELVEQYIREHGYPTYGAELAVINNYTENPTECIEAWQSYIGVRHEAKQWAEAQPHREEI